MNLYIPSQLNLPAELLDQQVKSLYFTAPHSGAGTSTCTLAIAKQLSTTMMKRVVVVDGNPGPSSISKHLKLLDKPGVCNYNSPHQDCSAVVQPVQGEIFNVVPCGKVEDSSQNANRHQAVRCCLEQLTSKFDIVLYDAPAVYTRDNQLALAALFNGTILVIDSRETRKEVADSAKDILAQMNLNLVGTVLNQRKYHVPRWLYNML